jgi:hypothetical protein
LFSHPSIAKEVRNRRIRSLLTARHDAKYQSDYSNSIVKRIFADHSNNEITPYILGVEEGVELTANQLTLTREKMSIVMDMETLIGQKYEEKYDYISSILLRISDPNIFSEYLDWKSTWKQKYSMPVLIKRIHSNKCVEIKSDNTLLRWYNDFKRSSNHGWAMDMRGSYDRGEFFLLAHSLDEISLQERVIHYEKCALQNMIEGRGHIFLASVACHPEMAGNGIEYCWGYGETIFRKINDKIVKNLRSNVAIAISPAHLTLERIWKFSRRPREYMRMYHALSKQILATPKLKEEINHEFLERNRKEIKGERNNHYSPDLVKSFAAHAKMKFKSHRSVNGIDSNFIQTS